MTNSRIKNCLIKIYNNMKTRCYCESYPSFSRYGGRGITICDEWLTNKEEFFRWALLNGYSSRLKLDRKRNDESYSPENCRFVTQKHNCRNRSSNKSVTIQGETKLLCEWIEQSNVKKSTFYERLRRGWTVENALTIPVTNQ